MSDFARVSSFPRQSPSALADAGVSREPATSPEPPKRALNPSEAPALSPGTAALVAAAERSPARAFELARAELATVGHVDALEQHAERLEQRGEVLLARRAQSVEAGFHDTTASIDDDLIRLDQEQLEVSAELEAANEHLRRLRDNPASIAPRGGYALELRIDVPGESPSPKKYDHRSGFDDFGHVSVHLESPAERHTVGFYPARSPTYFDSPDEGVPGRVVDDAEHPYEYSARYEITKEEHAAAKEYTNEISQTPPAWSANHWCADFALDTANAAGVAVETQPRTHDVGFGVGELRGVYPGDLAADLYEQQIGHVVGDGEKGPKK